MPQISWGNAVLAATYMGLCSAVTRPTSREAILLGCPLLLQMWIHERFAHRSSKDGPLGVRGGGRRHRSSRPPHHGFFVVSPEGNDLPLRDSSRYDFCSSIHLTFLVLCSMFGLGSSRRRLTRTSLVRSNGWLMPGPVDAVRSCHGCCPCTTGALVPVHPRPGLLDDAETTGLRRLRREVRRPHGDDAVRPLPGCASTRCATSAASRA
jgi:hypothetical protein